MKENQNIEFKSSWHDDYLKWICGFANAQGGTIFIGKDDNGKVIGLQEHKKLLDEIPNKIHNLLGIIPQINIRKSGTLHFIEIKVSPCSAPISFRGRYYYRSGSTKQELTGSALTDFLLRKFGKTWDDVTETSAKYNDIDLKIVEFFRKKALSIKRISLAASNSDTKLLFENLLLSENKLLKRAALLLFGKDPRKFFINAYLKIGRFGKTDDDLRSQEVIESNALQLADNTIEILEKKYLVSPISYKGLYRIEGSEYPTEALREVLLNAIIHRDYMGAPILVSVYEDKLMVWNEGSLPPDLSIELLKKKHPSRPRNPRIADIFFKAGLIESWGRGTLKIINECKKSGLPEPQFEMSGGGFSVTLFKKPIIESLQNKINLNERQQKTESSVKTSDKIIEIINNNNDITIPEMAEIIGISVKAIEKQIGILKKSGTIRREGSNKKGRWVIVVKTQ